MAAARTIDGPPMSISSTSSSNDEPGLARASANGYRLTTTSSNGAIPAAASASRWSARRRSARRPAWIRGWSVLTRPSSISGKPVTAATSVTGSPASRRARAVPPVQTSSNPRATRPAPSSARPALSDTDRSARRGTGSSSNAPARNDASAPIDRPRQQRRDDRRQELVLGGVDPRQERRLIVAGEDRNRLLGHDRAAVERRVDEVDGDAGQRDACGERVAHGVEPRERRQQRGVDVEDPTVERRQDRGPEQPQVARQDHGVRRDRRQCLGQRRVVAARDERRLDPLLGRPVERRARAVGEHQRRPAPRRPRDQRRRPARGGWIRSPRPRQRSVPALRASRRRRLGVPGAAELGRPRPPRRRPRPGSPAPGRGQRSARRPRTARPPPCPARR